MTVDANRLTKRATMRPANLGLPPGLSTGVVRAWLGALERLGHDVDAVLSEAGLRRGDLEDPDARVPNEACGAILRRVRQLPGANPGLRLAAATPIGAYPLIDYLVVTSETVGRGVTQLARYFHLTGAPVALSIADDGDPIRLILDGRRDAFGVEYTTSLIVLHLREETGDRFGALGVSFTHDPGDAAEFERLLGCAVHGGASWSGLSIAREAWGLPMRRRDPVLRGVLEQHADAIAARMPMSEGVPSEVSRLLASRMAGGDTNVKTAARLLNTSVRTLQRQLAAAGLSYQELLDSTRHNAAVRYLTDFTLSIGEVAYLLGYSEPSAFHRAFKRWTGSTPQAFRSSAGGPTSP
jgi:AraC-like DNA-binding protein